MQHIKFSINSYFKSCSFRVLSTISFSYRLYCVGFINYIRTACNNNKVINVFKAFNKGLCIQFIDRFSSGTSNCKYNMKYPSHIFAVLLIVAIIPSGLWAKSSIDKWIISKYLNLLLRGL